MKHLADYWQPLEAERYYALSSLARTLAAAEDEFCMKSYIPTKQVVSPLRQAMKAVTGERLALLQRASQRMVRELDS